MKKVIELIKKDDLNSALSQLETEYKSNNEKRKIIYALKSRLNENEQKLHKGLITREEYLLERNRIRNSIISIDEIEVEVESPKTDFTSKKIKLIGIIVIITFILFSIFNYSTCSIKKGIEGDFNEDNEIHIQ